VRLVLDTSVLVAAFRSPRGASAALLRLAAEQRFIMLATPALFAEYEDVLSRPEHMRIHRLSTEQLEDALNELASLVYEVRLAYDWRPQLSDPDDEKVLDAAINGFADAIVTHNLRHFTPAQARFGITVVTPGIIMKERFR
jgi:putative PIN family toxin of toxin-antitoxin system